MAFATAADVRRYRELERGHIELARRNASAFITYVLKDEESGRPILQSPIHEDWHRLVDAHKRLLIWAHVEAGKTNQLAIGRVLYELGRNPNLRVVIASNTDGQSQKICQVISKYIETSPELHRVFPNLRKAKSSAWTQHQLFVERPTKAKDPSVQTCGIHGNIQGSRIDLLILDDILDYENTTSATQREDLWHWYQSTLLHRMTRDSRTWCIGNAWHREDIMHRFARQTGVWFAKRYPVLETGLDDKGQETLIPTWPERWSLERIAERRRETLPAEFSRMLMCVARSDEDARFKRDWIDNCLRRGLGRPITKALVAVPGGYRTYTGVDLGVRTKDGSDLTSIFTIVVHPNEDREVLEVQAGRWAGPEIVARIIDTHNRFYSVVLVENNAAQQFIVDFTKQHSAVPVKPFTTTGQNIHHPEFGIESLATEMANGKWIIPSRMEHGKLTAQNEQIDSWINELLYYDPKSHPGDRLMSSWFAVSGAKMVKPKVHYGRLNLGVG